MGGIELHIAQSAVRAFLRCGRSSRNRLRTLAHAAAQFRHGVRCCWKTEKRLPYFVIHRALSPAKVSATLQMKLPSEFLLYASRLRLSAVYVGCARRQRPTVSAVAPTAAASQDGNLWNTTSAHRRFRRTPRTGVRYGVTAAAAAVPKGTSQKRQEGAGRALRCLFSGGPPATGATLQRALLFCLLPQRTEKKSTNARKQTSPPPGRMSRRRSACATGSQLAIYQCRPHVWIKKTWWVFSESQ